MSASEKTISALIESELPDFVNSEHPQFKRFLELYYQWMEQNSANGISNTAGNTIYHAMKIGDYRDIDQTPPEFVKYFKDEIIPYFPENTSLTTEKIIKSAREFYSKKGSDESLRWLFKALFNEDIEVNYPKEQILKTSDGKWNLPRAFRITINEENKNIDVNLLERRLVVGTESGATCVVESANRNIDPTNGKEVLEIYVSNLKKFFNNGEFIEITYVDTNGSNQIFREKIIGTLSNIRVDSNIRTDPQQRRRGLLYNVGDPIVIVGGLGDSAEANDAAAVVGNVTLGSIEAVTQLFKGYGYRTYTNTEVIVYRSVGDDDNANLSTDLRVVNINLTACTTNSQANFFETITYDKSVLDYLGNTQIGAANLAAFTVNNRNIVINVTEDDADDFFLNYAYVWANGNNYTDALFTGKIATPNGNTKILGTVNVSTSNVVIGTNTAFDVELTAGQKIQVAGERRTIDAITNNFYLTVASGFPSTLTAQTAYRIGNFAAQGGFGTEYTGDLIIYDIANTGELATVLTGAQLNVLNTTTIVAGSLYNTDKSFTYNSLTTYLLPTNANSQLVQAFDFETVNTGGIDLISVINGGGGFRSEPQINVTSYYDTHLSDQYNYFTEYSDKVDTRQTFTNLGLIAHVFIRNGGSLYSVNDAITFSGRGYGGNGYVQSVNSTGAITSVILTDRGEGYQSRPEVLINRANASFTNVSGTVDVAVNNSYITGTSTSFVTDLRVQDIIKVNNEIKRVVSIANNTYLTVNSRFNTTGTGNVLSKQNGTEATLIAYLYGDGETHTIETSAVGRVRDINLIYRGYDYISIPLVSLKVYDAVVNEISENDTLTETEYIYQGASLAESTFKANVKSYTRSSNLLRMYNYSGLIDPTVSLITANGITISVNTSANVPAPEQYPASVRATGLSDPDRPGTLRYGNGRARAVALFANGLIEFNGFYLNTDGFPSSDKVLQDSDLYHNFSYIVQSEKNLIEFEVPIKNIVHPAGMSLISKTVLKSEEIEATSAESNVHIIMPGPGPDAVTVSNSYSNVIVGFQTIWDPDANSVYYANSKVNVGDLFIIDDGNRVPISRIVTDVVSNTELRIAGDFIYPGPGLISFTPNYAGISGTVTVNPAVDGSVTINAPITGNVLLNPPITGTVNIDVSNIQLTYNLVNGTANIDSTSIVVGTNTDFGNQLEIGDVIKINNEVRRIDTIGFATLPGTANIAASNVVVGNNTSFVSYVRANDQISVNGTIKTVVTVTNNEHLIVNTAYANTNTDSVIVLFSSNVLTVNSNFATSGNAQSIYLKDGYISAQTGIYLTGNNTTFTTNLVANDIITVNNQVRQVVNVINNTYLQVNSRFYYSGTDNTCFLRSNAIVGNSTLFTTNLAANDIITVNNEIRQVVNVVNATYMTVNAALNNYAIGETVYKRSNVVIGSATNFDPQVNIGDIITVNNEIREVTVVTSDTELEVNVPFTEYATSQSLYKHNTEILGSATSFDTELVANSIIKVNNQIREVIAVTNAVVLTINAPFQYNETGNAISKLQPTELTVSANSSDLNSYLFPGDNISFNIVASNIMMAQTGTVNVFTTNTLVVGTSTSFDTQLVPNNTIMINGQLKLVVNIANATTLNVNSAFTSNLTNKILYKQATYQNANVVSITANVVTTNLEINGSGTNLVYLVDPNYVNIDFVGSVDISGNVVTANTSNAETISSYVGYIYIGNEIIANGETRTVVNVQSNNITVNSDFDNSGDDKYLAVYENHSFNVVTLTAY